MKIRIRNVDFEPFLEEMDLPESDGLYPHLRMRHYGDTVLALALKPGPFVELVLAEKDLALKRGAGGTPPGEEETVMSMAEGIEPVKSDGERTGVLGRLFGREKKAGIQIRIRTKDVEQYVFETALAVGSYVHGVFQGTLLYLYRYADSVAAFSILPGPMLDIFLMNGTIWRVDAEDEEEIIMSTEEEDFRVGEGEQLSNSAKQRKALHFGLPF